MNWTRPLELFLKVALGLWLLEKILKPVKKNALLPAQYRSTRKRGSDRVSLG
jgi:hypothetical protein